MKTIMLFKPNVYGRWDAYTEILEAEGFKIVEKKVIFLNIEFLELWYCHIVGKPFFKEIEEFMLSTPVLVLLIEGEDVIQNLRDFMGPTDPKKARKNQLRFGMPNLTQNGFHASSSKEDFANEIALIERFFGPF